MIHTYAFIDNALKDRGDQHRKKWNEKSKTGYAVCSVPAIHLSVFSGDLCKCCIELGYVNSALVCLTEIGQFFQNRFFMIHSSNGEKRIERMPRRNVKTWVVVVCRMSYIKSMLYFFLVLNCLSRFKIQK